MAFRSLTVGELKAQLQQFDDETPVAVAAPAGDYWGNVLALGIRQVESRSVSYSTYHQQFKVPRGEQGGEDNDEKEVHVVLLE